MRCYLVRHGQTLWNLENRFQGRTNSALTPLGLDQARRLGGYFAGRPIRAVYHSGLGRTVQTAEPIGQRLGLVGEAEPRVAEIDLGDWEGLTPDQINARYDGAYQTWRAAPSRRAIPGGELLAEFRARVRGGVEAVLARHAEEEVVIVSHGGAIASVLADWLGADYDQVIHRMVLSNGGVSAVQCDAELRHVLWVNATGHLAHEVTSPVFPPVVAVGQSEPDARLV